MTDCIAPVCCPVDSLQEPPTMKLKNSTVERSSSPLSSLFSKGDPAMKLPSAPKYLPILIIPGFMSSGLEIKKSKISPSWQGERLWLNLSSLGLSAMYFGGAQKSQKDESVNESQQKTYKSAWLEHMRLNPKDMKSDPDGVKVRAIMGLQGVDYLTPGAFTNHVSYVFGPVIEALKAVGYTEGVNLQAAPYDWRLPPLQLEQRDGYFTRAIRQVEELHWNNHSTPVVLIGHSLGTKTAHYFLNFCLQKKGQAWIDKHIHTYVPVGGPHLGAPKALRSTIAGDKMSLDTFLNDEEALLMGRSFGSAPWLFPQDLPPGVPSSVYVLPHGVLQVSFEQAVDTHQLINQRRGISKPNRYQLIVTCGNQNHKVSTPFHKVSSGDGQDVVMFREKISFATDPEKGSRDERAVQFFLQEPGIAAAKHEKEEKSCNPLLCILKWITCCCIFDYFYRILRCLTCGVVQGVVLGADAMTSGAGGGTNLAFSEPLVISKAVWDGKTVDMKVKLYHKDDYGKLEGFSLCPSLKQARTADIIIRMKWIPYNREKSFQPICSPVCQPDPHGESLKITKNKKEYQEFSGYDLLEREGLTDTLQLIKDVYDGDSKIGPRSISSSDAPPVKRVLAIYGINLPTEIGGVYKRKDTCLSETNLKNLYKLDTKAWIDAKTGYAVKRGALLETTKTKQAVAGGRQVCGDGTVPYWSLQHAKTWKSSELEVSVVELDKAEHREILADKRFHEALLEYCKIKEESV